MQKFIKSLKYSPLSQQQKKTIRGQAIAGDLEGARKGFEKLMERVKQNV